MQRISRLSTKGAGLLVGLMIVAAACGSSSNKSAGSSATTATSGPSSSSTGTGSANKASAPGISPTKITLGLVTSLTGVESAQFNGAQQGAHARIALQNSEGGIDGRQLEVVTSDDASTQTGAASAVSELITNKQVFGLLFVSGVTGTAYKVPQQQGVPVVGAAVDGPEWGIQPNTNMFAVTRNQGPTGLPVSTVIPSAMKIVGATNVASLGNGNEPASAYAAKAFTAAAKSIGVNVGYQNYSIPLGSVDMTATALAMRQAKVNGFYAPTIETTVFALLSDLRNEGAVMKAAVLATGYGQEIFSQPTAVQAGQGALFSTAQTPVELNTPATQAEQQAFAKYENFHGIPNLNWTYGWLAADLFIQGLKVAGQNPTRTSFISNLRNVTNWDGEGLLPTASNFSLADYGHFPTTSCSYFVRLQSNSFVVINSGKPVCGSIANS